MTDAEKLMRCYEIYADAKEILTTGENKTAADSAEIKKAYAIVTAFKDVLEEE